MRNRTALLVALVLLVLTTVLSACSQGQPTPELSSDWEVKVSSNYEMGTTIEIGGVAYKLRQYNDGVGITSPGKDGIFIHSRYDHQRERYVPTAAREWNGFTLVFDSNDDTLYIWEEGNFSPTPTPTHVPTPTAALSIPSRR